MTVMTVSFLIYNIPDFKNMSFESFSQNVKIKNVPFIVE